MKMAQVKEVFLDREDIPYRDPRNSSSQEDDEIVDSYYRNDGVVVWVVRTSKGEYYQIVCE